MNTEYLDWAEGRFPYDRAACGFCITQHELDYCAWEKHRGLAVAAKEARLVELLNKLRKTDYAPRIKQIHEVFLKVRKKYRKVWEGKCGSGL